MPPVKSSSKYYPLFQRLAAGGQSHSGQAELATPADLKHRPDITFTLKQIEDLIGAPLPSSAQKRAWWSNRDSSSALQASAWIQAGYHVKSVDFEQQSVTFQAFESEYHIQKKDNAILWDQAAVKALRKHMNLTQAKFAQELGVRRQTVSEWENGVYEPERSTAKHLERLAQQKGFESQ